MPTFTTEDGEQIELETSGTFGNALVCHAILGGHTYPHLAFVGEVEVVLDVGANSGAAAVHFARHHPTATVHSFEPASGPFARLQRNTEAYPNVRAHPFALGARDREAVLYAGTHDDITGSLVPRGDANLSDGEPVTVRAAGSWATQERIERIDLLKVDVEGSELEVLTGLEPFLPEVKVLYVEYDSRDARREIAAMVDGTHDLYRGWMFLDQGEIVYLRSDYTDHPEAQARLLELFVAQTASGGAR